MDEIESVLDTNDAVCDLSKINLDENSKNYIISKLKQNVNVGLIRFNESEKEMQIKNKIEEILVENNQNYRLFPTDYIHCLLAFFCFKLDTEEEKKCFTCFSGIKTALPDSNKEFQTFLEEKKLFKLTKEWTIKEELRHQGYKSILYINQKTRNMVLAFQGLRIKKSFLIDLNCCLNRNNTDVVKSIDDDYLGEEKSPIKSVFDSMLGNKKENGPAGQTVFSKIQTQLAVEFCKQYGYTLSFTGFGFGAWLAEQAVFYASHEFDFKETKAVTFDGPGSKDYLKELIGSSEADTKFNNSNLDIVSYLTAPNLLNTFNEHAGRKVYRIEEIIKNNEIIDKIVELETDIKTDIKLFNKEIDIFNSILEESKENKAELFQIFGLIDPCQIDLKKLEFDDDFDLFNPINTNLKPLDLESIFNQLKELSDSDMLITKNILKFISKYNANDLIDTIQLIFQDLEKILNNCDPGLVTNIVFIVKNIRLETFEQIVKNIELTFDFLIELNEDKLKKNEKLFKNLVSTVNDELFEQSNAVDGDEAIIDSVILIHSFFDCLNNVIDSENFNYIYQVVEELIATLKNNKNFKGINLVLRIAHDLTKLENQNDLTKLIKFFHCIFQIFLNANENYASLVKNGSSFKCWISEASIANEKIKIEQEIKVISDTESISLETIVALVKNILDIYSRLTEENMVLKKDILVLLKRLKANFISECLKFVTTEFKSEQKLTEANLTRSITVISSFIRSIKDEMSFILSIVNSKAFSEAFFTRKMIPNFQCLIKNNSQITKKICRHLTLLAISKFPLEEYIKIAQKFKGIETEIKIVETIEGILNDKDLVSNAEEVLKLITDFSLSTDMKSFSFIFGGMKLLFLDPREELLNSFDSETGKPKIYKQILKWPIVKFKPSPDYKNYFSKFFNLKAVLDLIPDLGLVPPGVRNALTNGANYLFQKGVKYISDKYMSGLSVIFNFLSEVRKSNLSVPSYPFTVNEYNEKSDDETEKTFGINLDAGYKTCFVDEKIDTMHSLYCSKINSIDQLLYNLKHYEQELTEYKPIKGKCPNEFIRDQLIKLTREYEFVTNDLVNLNSQSINQSIKSNNIDIETIRNRLLGILRLDNGLEEFLRNHLEKKVIDPIESYSSSSFTTDLVILEILKDQIKETQDALKDNQYVFIDGKSGSGKTSIANKLVTLLRNDYCIEWIDAKSIVNEFRNYAEKLGIDFTDLVPHVTCIDRQRINEEIVYHQFTGSRELFFRINKKLGKLSGKPKLFILDDLNFSGATESLNDFECLTAFDSGVKFLITSNDSSTINNKIHKFTLEKCKKMVKLKSISLPEFKLNDALLYMRKNFNFNQKFEKKLANISLKHSNFLLSQFFSRLNKQNKDDFKLEKIQDYLEQVQPKNCEDLLDFFSYLDGRCISLDFIFALNNVHDDKGKDGLKKELIQLNNISELNLNKQNFQVEILEITQERIRNAQQKKNQISVIMRIVDTLNNKMDTAEIASDNLKMSNTLNEYFNHAIKILNIFDESIECALLYDKIGKIYENKLVKLEKAKVCYEKSLKIKIKKYIINGNILGGSYEIFFIKSVKHFFVKHLTESFINIGIVLKKQEKYDDALPYLENSYQIMQQISTKIFTNGQKENYSTQSIMEKKIEFFNDSFKAIKGAHSIYLDSKRNIGYVLDENNDYIKSIVYTCPFTKVKTDSSVIKDQSVCRLLKDIGFIKGKQEKFDEAREILEYCSFESEKSEGNFDLKFECQYLIGNFLFRQARYEEAIDYYKRSILIANNLENMNAKISTTLINIGAALNKQGKSDQALPFLRKSLCICRSLYETDNHPVIVANFVETSDALEKLGRCNEALKYYDISKNLASETLSQGNLITFYIDNRITNIHIIQGSFKSLGQNELAKGKNKNSKTNQEPQPPSINTVDPGVNPGVNPVDPGVNPGVNPVDPGVNPVDPGVNPVDPGVNLVDPGVNPNIPKPDDGKEEKVIINNDKISYYYSRLFDALNKKALGQIYESKNMPAEELYQKGRRELIRILQTSIGDFHNRIGRVNYFDKNFLESLENFQKSMKIATDVEKDFEKWNKIKKETEKPNNGSDSIEKEIEMETDIKKINDATFAASLNNIGLVYFQTGDQKSAKSYFYQSLLKKFEIHQTLLHPDIVKTISNYSLSCSREGDFRLAKKVNKINVEIVKELEKPEDKRDHTRFKKFPIYPFLAPNVKK